MIVSEFLSVTEKNGVFFILLLNSEFLIDETIKTILLDFQVLRKIAKYI